MPRHRQPSRIAQGHRGWAIQFNWTLDLGTVVQVLATVAAVVLALVVFKTKVELLLTTQSTLLETLTTRMERHEEDDERKFQTIQTRLTDLVGGVQRLVGQNETFRSGQDRRQ